MHSARECSITCEVPKRRWKSAWESAVWPGMAPSGSTRWIQTCKRPCGASWVKTCSAALPARVPLPRLIVNHGIGFPPPGAQPAATGDDPAGRGPFRQSPGNCGSQGARRGLEHGEEEEAQAQAIILPPMGCSPTNSKDQVRVGRTRKGSRDKLV